VFLRGFTIRHSGSAEADNPYYKKKAQIQNRVGSMDSEFIYNVSSCSNDEIYKTIYKQINILKMTLFGILWLFFWKVDRER
jgi:hypothetical protein